MFEKFVLILTSGGNQQLLHVKSEEPITLAVLVDRFGENLLATFNRAEYCKWESIDSIDFDTELVDVAFVIEPDSNVCAVMPGLRGSVNRSDTVTCYSHCGQHSYGMVDYFVAECTPARKCEYVDLLRELQMVGYNVRIIPAYAIADEAYARMRENS